MNVLFSSLSGNELTESVYYLRILRHCGHSVFGFSVPCSQEDPTFTWVEPGFAVDTAMGTQNGNPS
jgi:hypothetical protein